MITLNDYLYSGDTLLRILKKYIRDLRTEAKEKRNEIDLVHCNFLIQIQELLEHNDFLTAQSQKIREFYKYMAGEYPFLAFTFKGRIKSLIRAEEKFNGYVVEIIYVFLTIFLYLLKCPQSLILSALRAFCLCGKPHISRLIFLYFPCQSWLKSW